MRTAQRGHCASGVAMPWGSGSRAVPFLLCGLAGRMSRYRGAFSRGPVVPWGEKWRAGPLSSYPRGCRCSATSTRLRYRPASWRAHPRRRARRSGTRRRQVQLGPCPFYSLGPGTRAAASNTDSVHGAQYSASVVLSNWSVNNRSLSARVPGANRIVTIRSSTSAGSRSLH